MDGDGVYVSLHKNVGDPVQPLDVLAEVESDKATIEIVSPVAGTVWEIFVVPGTEVSVSAETQFCSIAVSGAPVSEEAGGGAAVGATGGGGSGNSMLGGFVSRADRIFIRRIWNREGVV